MYIYIYVYMYICMYVLHGVSGEVLGHEARARF